MKPPAKYNSLNDKQLYILKLAYKFRFITAPLLAEYKDLKSRHSMYITLELLAEQGYLLRRKDPTPFSNKGIRYCLAPKALPILRAEGLDEQVLHTMYKNKTVLEEFIDHQTAILKLYIALRDPKLHIFSKTEQYFFEDFPQPRSDLFIRRIKPIKTKPNLYFLELYHDQPLFITKKRLKALIAHYDTEWPDSNYPTLLFVLANERAAKSFQKYAANLLEERRMEDEIEVHTTVLDDSFNLNL
ncbi:MAG TPA: hypothetical protein PKA02_03355 [Candidatus Saccharibacteria bacterium]|nr:hypothetical protein [Candidatus Saccharibacteria bacterium]